MKKRIRYGVAIVVMLLIVTGIFFFSGPAQKEIQRHQGIQMVQGLIATWEYIDRDISLDYFYQLDHTTTYRQIVKEIGGSNGGRGSGLVMPYWQIDNDLFAVMEFSLDESGEWDKLGFLQICDHDGTLETINLWLGDGDKKAPWPFRPFDGPGNRHQR